MVCLMLLGCSAKYTPTGESRSPSERMEHATYTFTKVSDPTPQDPNLVLKCGGSGTIVKSSMQEFRVKRLVSPVLQVLTAAAGIGSGLLLGSRGYVVLGRDVGAVSVTAALAMAGYSIFNGSTEWREQQQREQTTFAPAVPFSIKLRGTNDSSSITPERDGTLRINLLDHARYYPEQNLFTYEIRSPDGERVAEFTANPGQVIPFIVSDVDVEVPETGVSNPDAVAVVIGVSTYDKPGVPPVEFALRDAEAVKNYLVKTLGFAKQNVIYLSNPSKADFERVFGTAEEHRGELFNFVRAGASDVFVYYSGHGAPDIESRSGYFVPADCSPDYVRLNGYSLRTFYENLTRIPAKSTTVVIDACFSGGYDRGLLGREVSGITMVPKANVLPPNVNVLTSCDSNQVASWYPDKRHGLYTYYLLKGIRNAFKNGPEHNLTLGELHTYVSDSVSYVARRQRGRTQTPTFFGDASMKMLFQK